MAQDQQGEHDGQDHQGQFARAQQFLWLNGRLLERRLCAYLFAGAPRAGVLAALAAYQNANGGFGEALEPDIRAPVSQPAAIDLAFHVLDMVQGFADPMVARACDYLVSISTTEGGIPTLLPSARDYPHAPWWAPEDNPPAALNPTAALVGLLRKHHVEHPWLAPATEYCWRAIAATETTEFHTLMPVLIFLESAPDRQRADEELARVRVRIAQPGVVEVDPLAEGYVHGPLEWAPEPGSPCSPLFGNALIAAHLRVLATRQQPDGGWPISWPPVSPAGELEWRGWATVLALRTLRAYGALGA